MCAAGAVAMRKNVSLSISRRSFCQSVARTSALGALLSAVPRGWAGSTPASDAPETSKMKFGIIALTDCSPIVIAHEKGLFKKYGIESTVSKGANWAAIRDSLSSGDIQGTHMLLGMPIASTMGLLGSPKKPMIIPWILNRNGQSISLKNGFKGKVQADPKALKPFVDKAKSLGEPLTFAMTFPPGTHAMWTRYYLGAGGINPDKDVSLIVIPPPQMVANMKVGSMHFFCVGEPWNAQLIHQKIGFSACTTQQIWVDHPEKTLGVRADWVEKNPKTALAVTKAVLEAQIWCDKPENKKEMCEIVSRRSWFNVPVDDIIGRTNGEIDFGDGRKIAKDPNLMKYWKDFASYPFQSHELWFLTENIRWGNLPPDTDTKGLVKKVNREDIWRAAAKAINAPAAEIPASTSRGKETFFDGKVFDPENPAAYLASLAIKKVAA